MTTIFELWGTESGNFFGTYATEDEALADVYTAVVDYGLPAVATLLLGQDRAAGHSCLIASGGDLADRAEKWSRGRIAVEGE